MNMYSVDKVEVILTVPSIEETQSWYERVLGWQGYCDVHDAQGRCGLRLPAGTYGVRVTKTVGGKETELTKGEAVLRDGETTEVTLEVP